MMELTPLDVRKKKGDFRRALRGYDPGSVDDFLDLVADRLETLVRDAAAQKETSARLEQQVADYRDREKALTEALVTAQEMREEIRAQSTREVDILRRQAEQDAESIRAEAMHLREREEESLIALRNKQLQFLASYRSFLEQELSDLAAHARGVEMQAGLSPGTRFGRAGAASPRPPSRPADNAKPADPAKTVTGVREPEESPPAAPERPDPGVATAGAVVAGREAAPAAQAEPAMPPRPVPPAPRGAARDPAEEEIDAHVGAALAEWTTEFDEVAGEEAEPELLLSDADVVTDDPERFAAETAALWADEMEPEPEPEAPVSRFADPAFREEIRAAFSDSQEAREELLDLDAFDSLRGGVDPALGESIVGPPPVIPPDQLTISPAFLERAGTERGFGRPPEDSRPETAEAPRRQDLLSSMFGDDG